MVHKQVKALTVLYRVPCQHFGVYFAPYQILLVMGAVFVLLAIPFLLFYDRTVLPLCNRCLPRQEYASMPLRRPGLRPRCLRAEIRRVDAQPRPMSMSLLEKCSLLDDMPLAFCIIELVFNEDGHGVDFIFRYCNAEMATIEGVPVEEMLGRSFYEVFPNGDKKWLVSYADVALNGTKHILHDYSPEVDEYLTIHCYQPEPGYCACVLQAADP